jgi:isoamylase
MASPQGKPYPLGATYDGAGVNFSLFSSVADRVDVCLFDDEGHETQYNLPEMTGFCWHGYFPGLRPGQRYGFRVHGPWAPQAGLRCNPTKLLLDPYARCIQGQIDWDEAVFSHYFLGDETFRNDFDSAPYVPRSVVTDSRFDWDSDRLLHTPWDVTVIYEVHVKGFTIKHPAVPPVLRGTYLGLAHPAVINHLQSLGVTAVELMPVHQFAHEMHLVERGLANYWGYSTIGFFAPHNAYSTNMQDVTRHLDEFKLMVKILHSAGLEVILDVVYGHTAEGNHRGPVLSFKGIDNAAYYQLDPDNPLYYRDFTGTGNSLNVSHPYVLQLMMDSLRYWVMEMHVDGFRFDLASALARGSAFFDVIQQDPVVGQVKLIAEPWDVSHGGYQLGNFPTIWSEWNGRFRDSVRDYWRACDGSLREFSFRVSGSPDLYETARRRPSASVNFVTCHDGFTLADLVAYNEKHNWNNGEWNFDGENDNRSWNCGAEGPTSNGAINALRRRQCRNLLATLMLSQGVPMLLSGDEIGRTQQGNNNAYCQDNELSWIDWEHADTDLYDFVRKSVALRRAHPVLRRRHFDTNIDWYRSDGETMSAADWNTPWVRAVGMFLEGSASDDRDGDFYIAFNAHFEAVEFTIPHHVGRFWQPMLYTGSTAPSLFAWSNGTGFYVEPHSLLVLARTK